MNTKLFKKLNEQMEINQTTNQPISENEKNRIESELIFGDLTESITDNMNICEGLSNSQEDARSDQENKEWEERKAELAKQEEEAKKKEAESK